VIDFKALDIHFVETASQVAGVLTKSLTARQHRDLSRFMLGKQVPAHFWHKPTET
jgi:hypothetical protein